MYPPLTEIVSVYKNFSTAIILTAGHLKTAGVIIKPFKFKEATLFKKLPIDEQIRVLKNAWAFEASLNEIDARFMRASQQSLWRAFRFLGLIPPSDLLDQINAEHAIEIYDLEGKQIWRNLACLELCSYSLEEIVCMDVFDRYARDQDINLQCLERVKELLSGERPEVFDPQIARHEILETESDEKFRLSVKHKLFSRLYNSKGIVAAWLVMTDAYICEDNEAHSKLKLVKN